jgi:hypothetical protein
MTIAKHLSSSHAALMWLDRQIATSNLEHSLFGNGGALQ